MTKQGEHALVLLSQALFLFNIIIMGFCATITYDFGFEFTLDSPMVIEIDVSYLICNDSGRHSCARL